MDPQMIKSFIKQISKEKDLDPTLIKNAIERSILAASRKNLSNYRDAVANLDMESGELTVSVTKDVVADEDGEDRHTIPLKMARKLLKNKKLQVGEEVIVPIDPSEFGRIAAQSARQIVMQQIRDAERNKTYEEYKDRIGQVVTGIIARFEHRDVVMNIGGRAEGLLPYNEQPYGAKYQFNERLKVIINRVEMTPRGPQIILSRKSPQLVVELFKQEVPEILDGTVQIVGIAREAGVRMKIAVKSLNSDVDPVGACVGMKGSRVQMVVRELENEKIDIVPWSPDARTFVSNALNPAKIVDIDLDERAKTAHVVVAQGNLAIAIGRKGQNTKLAAKLTGYRLDIRSENEDELAYEEIQRRYLEDFLGQIEGLTELGAEGLMRSSYNSVEKISRTEPAKLRAFTGDDDELAEELVTKATSYAVAVREMEDERRKKISDDPSGESSAEGAEASEAVADDEEKVDAGGDAGEGASEEAAEAEEAEATEESGEGDEEVSSSTKTDE